MLRISKLTLARGAKRLLEDASATVFPGHRVGLVGPNGAGKSNFISFFKMLSYMVGSENGLQDFVVKYGGANSILHDGAQITEKIEALLTIKSRTGENDYLMRLSHAAPDTLVFIEERYRFSNKNFPSIEM